MNVREEWWEGDGEVKREKESQNQNQKGACTQYYELVPLKEITKP